MTTLLKRIGKSNWFDYIGVAIVVFVAYQAGYLFSTLDTTTLFTHVAWASFVPLGIISATSAVLSILSTRFTAKISYLGNIIGTFNVVLAGAIDYVLGNQGAVLTYPLSFIVNFLAIYTWHRVSQGNKLYKPTKLIISVILVACFGISFGLNAVMFQDLNMMYYLSSTVFGFSLTANILNVFKVDTQWSFWGVYNIIQLAKAVSQGNFANVGKYIYYIINSIMALLIWREK